MNDISVEDTDLGRRFARVAIAAAAALLLSYAIWSVYRVYRDPGIAFLQSEGGAEWIRFDDAASLRRRPRAPHVVEFRRTFLLADSAPDSVVRLKLFRAGQIFIDNRMVYDTGPNPSNWKDWRALDLRQLVRPGPHEVRVAVTNDMGPPALLAQSRIPGFSTAERWEAARDGHTWVAARRTATGEAPPPFLGAPKAGSALAAQLPLYVSLSLAVFIAAVLARRRPSLLRFAPTPSAVRWAMLACWCLFGLVNFTKLPANIGFDSTGHMEYIKYVVEHGRIPLATEGWQLFQSPLYYLICAPLYAALGSDPDSAAVLYALRSVSLLCGAAQVEIAYRALRYVFAGRKDLQAIGTAFAGCVPMNIYMAHYVSNEPLAGTLGAAVVLAMLPYVYRPRPGTVTLRRCLVLGAIFGLAMLAKVSAVLLAAPIAAALAYAARMNAKPGGRFLPAFTRSGGTVFGAALVVSGWYYVRNWILMGVPFMGGWDPRRGADLEWWQDPGYRDWGQFLRFGAALTHPIYAGVTGVWDGVYATFWSDSYLGGFMGLRHGPPWNYEFQATAVWLALAPTAAMAAGVVWTIRHANSARGRALLLCCACAGVFGAALFHLCFTVPFYCTTKAFYTLGAMPCYALLAAAGFDVLTRRARLRPVVYALFACWAVSSLLSFVAV
ncbi:MAG: hypothetical protein HZB26_25875 [Candidatus Hydrogenedentes bacterium]|nr:hypothetical protein [Candidatus Hydrogenedentota bacterium]